jgi:DNA-binding CsgD family transcriptional regulator
MIVPNEAAPMSMTRPDVVAAMVDALTDPAFPAVAAEGPAKDYWINLAVRLPGGRVALLQSRRIAGPNIETRALHADLAVLVRLWGQEQISADDPDGLPPVLQGKPLIPEQRETLIHLLQGAQEPEIADATDTPRNTVHSRVQRLYKAYDVPNRMMLLVKLLPTYHANR